MPYTVAAVCEGDRMTFAELDRRSSLLALKLKEIGVHKDTCVPILINPGLEVLVAILGILKAGGAYVPIDSSYPIERIAYILSDAQAKTIICSRSLAHKLPKGLKVISIDDHQEVVHEDMDGVIDIPEPNDLAYVIYTSGSTGRPKGVMVEHSQLYHYVTDIHNELRLDECATFAILGTFSADAGHTAVFEALAYGKTLYLLDVKNVPIHRLVKRLSEEPVDCYKITPSLLNIFLQYGEVNRILARKKVIIGGEPFNIDLVHRLYRVLPTGCRVYNHYGPTEATVGVLTYEFPEKIEQIPSYTPLGKPLSSVRLFILNEKMEPVKKGDLGELYIEGALIARGYLNNQKLTKARFINKNTDEGSLRLYKTGDLVQEQHDTGISYCGRVDDQVKINGYRIEPKEIEQVINHSGMVNACVVVGREVPSGNTNVLVGYLVTKKNYDQKALGSYMKLKLPGYMVPKYWVTLNALPLTVNNKIDKTKLPEPLHSPSDKPAHQATVVDDEDQIKAILLMHWQRILDVPSVSPEDDFFDIGGDSLKIIQLSIHVSDSLKKDVSAVDLYNCSVFSEMVDYMNKPDLQLPETEKEVDPEEVTIAQKNLFIHNKLHPQIPFPHSSITFRINGNLNSEKLEKAFQKLINDHEILKSIFVFDRGKVKRRQISDFVFEIIKVNCPTDNIEEEILKIIEPFNMGQFPLLKAYILHLKDSQQFFHIEMPHINSDGESLKLIMHGLESEMNNLKQPERKEQFTDFLKVNNQYLQTSGYVSDRHFWSQEVLSSLEYAMDDKIRSKSQYNGAYVVFDLDCSFLDQLNGTATALSGSKFYLMLAAYYLLLHDITGAEELVVMVPVHNRNEKNTQQIIGLLSNVVLVKLKIHREESYGAFLERLKKKFLQVSSHQRFPLEDSLALFKNKGGNPRNLLEFFFGFHQHSPEYGFGDASLTMHIPIRDKENLPLSMAVFDMGSRISLRLSSNIYDSETLRGYCSEFSRILHQLIDGDEKRRISAVAPSKKELKSI